ncbi:hypothetical protein K7432_001703 [Basidiobolus ranarum]|uniref:RNA helicase n=1 Tax=Basidiobolus ranarum TaxID=34480 RepID=A0ABR2W934_9FUNG
MFGLCRLTKQLNLGKSLLCYEHNATIIGKRGVPKAFFSNTSLLEARNASMKKPNVSTLTKHMKPDGMTGYQRRAKLLREQSKKKSPVSKKTRGFVPVRFKLLSVDSDVKSPSTKIKKNKPGEETVKDFVKRANSSQFEDFKLREEVYAALKKGPLSHVGEHVRPTEIQTLAIPEILKGRSQVLCAAETGSGKTLAYLLPLINKLKEQEAAHEKQVSTTAVRKLNKPRVVILVPSRELVNQVINVGKSMCHHAKFRIAAMTNAMTKKNVLRAFESPVDVLVATPASLLHYFNDKDISFADTFSVVIDEADSMFDGGFGDEIKDIFKYIKRSRETQNLDCQFIVVSATLPKKVNESLDKMFPQLFKITTPSLHKALPRLRQNFVDLARFQGNKQMAILDVLRGNSQDRTMIFTNTKHGAKLLHNFLDEKNIKTYLLSGDTSDDARDEMVNSFKDGTQESRIMVCTDIASRGLDVSNVHHVILYDFPSSVVDYLHRVGRTARAGSKGKATSLVARKNRNLADRIQRSIRDGTVLS